MNSHRKLSPIEDSEKRGSGHLESLLGDLSDQELLSLFLQNHLREAMEIIALRHGKVVAGVASRLLNDRSDIEDVFQATFVVLFRSAKRIRKGDSLGSFLYGVAYRIGKRLQIRRSLERRRAQEVTCDMEQQVASQDPTPPEALKMKQELEALEEELQRLPSSMRTPIIEHYIAGRSVPQLATEMQLTVTTVEGRIRRGKERLKQNLERRGVGINAAWVPFAQWESQLEPLPWEEWVEPTIELSLSQIDPSMGSPAVPFSTALEKLVQGELSMFYSLRASTLAFAATVGGLLALGIFAIPIARSLQPSGGEGPRIVSQAQAQLGPPQAQSESNKVAEVVAWETSGPPPAWLQDEYFQSANAAEEEVRIALRRKVRVDFDGVPLREVISEISEATNIAFFIDKKSVGEEGHTEDEPITLLLGKELEAQDALDLILSPLTLAYFLDGEIVKISSERFSGVGTARAYELSHVFSDNSVVWELVGLITETILQDEWVQNGGESTINVFGAILFVSCSETNHRKIEKLLYMISKQPKGNMKPNRREFIGGNGMGGMGGMGGMF